MDIQYTQNDCNKIRKTLLNYEFGDYVVTATPTPKNHFLIISKKRNLDGSRSSLSANKIALENFEKFVIENR
jgi:hypothetical protein